MALVAAPRSSWLSWDHAVRQSWPVTGHRRGPHSNVLPKDKLVSSVQFCQVVPSGQRRGEGKALGPAASPRQQDQQEAGEVLAPIPQ